MRDRRRRRVRIEEERLRKAKASAKRKITLHIRKGKPPTEDALMQLIEASVKTAAPKASAAEREDAALTIMIDLAAHIARLLDEEDAIALLLM